VGHDADTIHERWQYPPAPEVIAALQIVCAWCQQHIVWHRVLTPLPFPISYSICAHCYADVAREFASLTAEAP
jgi:hypothetical protein